MSDNTNFTAGLAQLDQDLARMIDEGLLVLEGDEYVLTDAGRAWLATNRDSLS